MYIHIHIYIGQYEIVRRMIPVANAQEGVPQGPGDTSRNQGEGGTSAEPMYRLVSAMKIPVQVACYSSLRECVRSKLRVFYCDLLIVFDLVKECTLRFCNSCFRGRQIMLDRRPV